jgi:hypothetical protein
MPRGDDARAQAPDHLLAPGEEALRYAERGWKVFPVHCISGGRCTCGRAVDDKDGHSPGKHPRTKHGLKDASDDPAVITRWWSKWPDANVGIATGEASGFVVIDIDPRNGGDTSLKALIAEHGDLPETLETRTGGGGSHYFFAHPGGKIACSSSKVAPGVDVKGDGGYVVAPPSVHESGDKYEWMVADVESAPLPQWLLALVQAPARDGASVDSAAQVGASGGDKIPERQRNSHLTSIAGSLRSRGCDEAVMLAALMEENRSRCEPVLGDSEVERIAKSVARYAPEVAEPAVRELNKKFAYVLVGDKDAVLREHLDAEGRKAFSLMGFPAMKRFLANKPAIAVSPNKSVSLADYWLKSPARRQYEGIAFSPGREIPDYYNLWRGFAVESQAGNCSLFLAHVRDNIARGDHDHFRWIMAWLADIVQNPGRKPGTSLVIRGREGTGKTLFGRAIGSLLGEHYVLVSEPRYVTGQFNSHLASCLLLHADEAFWAGDKRAEGKIKDLVTGSEHLIEFKGKEPLRVRNHLRLLVTGNPDWLVPAGFEARRFAVFEISDARMQDHGYFKAIQDQLDNGGRAALLKHLLSLSISDVNLRQVPRTAALLDQQQASMTPYQAWWFDKLVQGDLVSGQWPPDIAITALVEDYRAYAKEEGARTRRDETSFGGAFKKLTGGKAEKLRKDVTSAAGHASKSERKAHYRLPPLDECRQLFVEALGGTPIDWDQL